ncbi:signal transduction histidine kinase/CheY-like chemotaxis protein/ligand-binding sensor domain-containing protein [Dysgonomonas sp. PFB1-18]|uniref:hybrid sensor histidine kinase/response regulator transcription factor n=1 Tax=unclassified Dysgonomonas TaxID=2630389 RepID=UPI002474AFB6|nr:MULTISPECIES: hybrid sensor histidine kinase/response regulator transcription factor [unclassified Dysgonomonas]MDH6311019.1 signal transduction histidine kinase/CheY-like chemotaxis protein/ligand-binding sensor domain-containing protein [Dysgonomonas sp. PF1-14]MDH6337868.1 signal transduction histidine kinase/CheY-like chemotaxis protein/ligand-binding sensor domain-containing protein [Dysgonomonas sp. PF1-16]MDH6382567.1 signal transduction histidine kinase/CheY-like chemotaxis protein/li
MKEKLVISTFLFLLSVLTLYPSDAKFYSINSIYGISVRETASICKDDNGFIWTSSKSGILRVTEDDYRIYHLPYKSVDVISVKLVYKESELYAYTNNGQIFVYDELLDKFNLFIDFRDLLNDNFLQVHRIIVHNKDAMWVSSSLGLFRYEGGLLKLVSKEQTEVQNIVLYDNHNLIYTTLEGIYTLDVKTFSSKLLHKNDADKELYVSASFYDDKSDRLWVGTVSSGLFYYNFKDKTLKAVSISNFPRQPILSIKKNIDSSLFIGIDGQGVWKLNNEGNVLLGIYKEDIDDPSSIRGDGVYDIFCDGSNKVWVATYSGGLSFFEQESPLVTQIAHKINTPNSLGNNYVNKILEDSRGNIWFATNNGISRWKVSTNQWDIFYQNKHEQAQVFLALCEDNNGNIWAGTYSSGVYVLDGNTGRELLHYSQEERNSDFPGRFIFDIFKDSQGDIWIGGIQSNVICYLAKENRFRLYPSQPVRSFTELSQGKLLLSCSHGLILLDKETSNEERLLDSYLIHGTLVIDDKIWVMASGVGLMQYDYNKEKEVNRITTESGLSSNFVNSLTYANGCLWIGTENGLSKYNPSDNSIQVYSSIFSFSNISFNINSACKLKNGSLIWGTNNGALMIDPNMLYQAQHQGQIFFQDITISGRSIRESPSLLRGIPVNKQEKIDLNYNQNTIALELVPIGVSSSGSKFSWKMEGLDTEWSQPTNIPVINYTNIPSGIFELKIRMYDSSISQVIDERLLTIKVVPPFWKTWWFSLILFSIIAGIIFFTLKIYINRLKQRHTEDKIRFFTNTAHDIRTSLTLINAPIEELNKEKNLSEKGQYYLNLATEQSGRLSFVATQLLDFQKVDIGKGQVFLMMTDIVNLVSQRKSMFAAAAKKQNINLEFQSSKESYITAVDELKIEKVVDNLISNAIKYSHPNGKIEISLVCEDNYWTLTVKDHGLGISDKAKDRLFREFYRGDNVVNSKMVGSGIGLLLVKNYVSMHNGTVSLDSKENKGSTFTITIPYKEVSDVLQPAASDKEKPEEIIVSNNDFSGLEILDKEVGPEKKIHVLIVEDNNDLQTFLKYSLQEQYNVTTADDGEEAWAMIQKKIPDLVVSDIMMPNMDGFELCRLMKSTFETSHIPVVLLTALSEKTTQLEGLGLGADDYITKPFDVSLLSQRIKTIVKNREIVREKALKLITRTDEEQPIFINELNDQFVKKAHEVVNSNISNSDFGKDEFASSMNVSSSLLYKKMKSLTGLSPIDFIKTIRLNQSLELLQSRKYTVTEVSELCGFSSIGYFSTVFKKHFGKSPTEILE